MASYWRDTARAPRFFMVDGRAMLPVFLLLFHARLWTFALVVATIAFLYLLQLFGLTPEALLRLAYSRLSGRVLTHRDPGIWRRRIRSPLARGP